jgi:hypothetical protein
VALLPVAIVLALAALVAGVIRAARRIGPSREVVVAAARRQALVVSVLAPLAAICPVVLLVVAGGDVGQGFPGKVGDALLMSPLAFALTHTVVLALGELAWPRPRGAVRRARLVRRGLLDAAPRLLVRLLLTGTLLLVVVLAVGAGWADPDGRSISRGLGAQILSAGPWPGWHYGRPAATELVWLAILVTAALWIVANRPAVATENERIESALRRASAHRVLRGATAGVLLLDGGLLYIGGNALRIYEGWAPVVVIAGAVCGLAGLAVLCAPAPRVPADTPAVPVG